MVFRIVAPDTILKDAQAGTIDSAVFAKVSLAQALERLTHYTIVTAPTSARFEALFFNFHNTVLASHLEVRQAMAMAIDQQALIKLALHGFAMPLCADHPSAVHPGYIPAGAGCPDFNPAAANKLLDDNGWLKGPDGIRAKGGERLEFEYSTSPGESGPWYLDVEVIVQRDLRAIGIQLDIQNYPGGTFVYPFLTEGQASPPTGAVAGRYDIAEYVWNFGYDPDDSALLSCDDIPPNGTGTNLDFYCNPALDALYQQEVATLDPGVRQQIFVKIHQIYLTDYPFIVLYSPPQIYLVRKGTHNYQPSLLDFEDENVWEWWCDKGTC